MSSVLGCSVWIQFFGFFFPPPVSFLLLSTVFPLKFLVDQLGLMRMDSLNRCVKVYFSSSFLKGSLPGVEFWSMLLYFLRLKMLFPHLPSDLSQKVFFFFLFLPLFFYYGTFFSSLLSTFLCLEQFQPFEYHSPRCVWIWGKGGDLSCAVLSELLGVVRYFGNVLGHYFFRFFSSAHFISLLLLGFQGHPC